MRKLKLLEDLSEHHIEQFESLPPLVAFDPSNGHLEVVHKAYQMRAMISLYREYLKTEPPHIALQALSLNLGALYPETYCLFKHNVVCLKDHFPQICE